MALAGRIESCHDEPMDARGPVGSLPGPADRPEDAHSGARNLATHLAVVKRSLSAEYASVLDGQIVARIVDDAASEFRNATVTAFIPVLTARFARSRVKELVAAARR